MCCFLVALFAFGPRLAILVWWILTPVYITTLFQTWIWPINEFMVETPLGELLLLAAYLAAE